MSRSLVGSSSSSTLGSVSSSRSSWKRRRSPPERSPIRAVSRSPVNPKRSSIEVAVISPSAVLVTRRIDSTVGSTRPLGSRSSSCWVRCWSATVRPCFTRPAEGGSAPAISDSTEVLPAPLTPTMPTRSPGPSRQVACDSSCRSPRDRSTSSTSMTSLPSRWVAKFCSSIRSRGGGTSSIRALAASIRNFGFEVRAGGAPAQPGQLLAGEVLPAGLRGRGLALALGLGEHERGVPALVGVDDPVVHLPRPLADRVEEPPVVGDDHQRRGPLHQVVGQPGDRLHVEVVGRARRARSGRGRRAAARPASSAGARHRRARPPPGPARPRPAAPRRSRGCAGPRPTRGRTGRRAPPHGRCGCRRARRPGGGSRSAARGTARRARCRAPRGRSSPPAAWSCRRRCGRRCRSARRRRCPARRR